MMSSFSCPTYSWVFRVISVPNSSYQQQKFYSQTSNEARFGGAIISLALRGIIPLLTDTDIREFFWL